MSILIAEDNVAQRRYLRELLEREFSAHAPVIEAADGEEAVAAALKERPELCVFDIQMPRLSGVKAARAIWRDFPSARIIFWTQFAHEVYINELRKIVRSVEPQPAYGFIHKNNPQSRFLRGVESRLATLYEKLFVSTPEGTPHEAYDKLAYNMRTRAFFEALRRGLINADELEKAAGDLEHWIERDRKRFLDEHK